MIGAIHCPSRSIGSMTALIADAAISPGPVRPLGTDGIDVNVWHAVRPASSSTSIANAMTGFSTAVRSVERDATTSWTKADVVGFVDMMARGSPSESKTAWAYTAGRRCVSPVSLTASSRQSSLSGSSGSSGSTHSMKALKTTRRAYKVFCRPRPPSATRSRWKREVAMPTRLSGLSLNSCDPASAKRERWILASLDSTRVGAGRAVPRCDDGLCHNALYAIGAAPERGRPNRPHHRRPPR
jgi:hypothetical protein